MLCSVVLSHTPVHDKSLCKHSAFAKQYPWKFPTHGNQYALKLLSPQKMLPYKVVFYSSTATDHFILITIPSQQRKWPEALPTIYKYKGTLLVTNGLAFLILQ